MDRLGSMVCWPPWKSVVAASEHDIQRAYFDWAKMHPEASRAYAIPNAAKRSPRLASYMIAEGLRKGVLDIHLPLPRGGCAGLWIEMKAGKNTLTTEQAKEAEMLATDGYAVFVCWDSMKAIEVTQSYLKGQVPPGLSVLRPAPVSSRSVRRTRPSSSLST